MLTRRQGREWAVMMLCECDQNPPDDIDAALAAFWAMLKDIERNRVAAEEYGVKTVFLKRGKKHAAALAEMKAFAEERVRGVMGGLQAIDAAAFVIAALFLAAVIGMRRFRL